MIVSPEVIPAKVTMHRDTLHCAYNVALYSCVKICSDLEIFRDLKLIFLVILISGPNDSCCALVVLRTNPIWGGKNVKKFSVR